MASKGQFYVRKAGVWVPITPREAYLLCETIDQTWIHQLYPETHKEKNKMDRIKRNKKKIIVAATALVVVGAAIYFNKKYFTLRPEVAEAAENAADAVTTLAKAGK